MPKHYRVVTKGHPVLQQVAEPVEDFDKELSKICKSMMFLMKAKDGVGLAAPQIGISKRFFVYQQPHSKPGVYINPVLSAPLDTWTVQEGCLSLPRQNLNIERPYSVTIEGYDVSGQPQRARVEGWLARIFQHEIDHLNGILIEDIDE